MNRDDFLQFLIETYEDFTEINTKPRLRAYKAVLKEDFNYDDLYKKTLENYQTFKIAPTPAQLLEFKNKKKSFDMNRDFFGIED